MGHDPGWYQSLVGGSESVRKVGEIGRRVCEVVGGSLALKNGWTTESVEVGI